MGIDATLKDELGTDEKIQFAESQANLPLRRESTFNNTNDTQGFVSQQTNSTPQFAEPKPSFAVESSNNDIRGINGVAGCLLVLDDTQLLREWLAYHHTILPLSSLIVAFDPKSSSSSIKRIENMTSHYKELGVGITLWFNDTFVPSEELRQRLHLAEKRENSGPLRGTGVRVPHKERQCQFVTECMRSHKAAGEKWVLLTDTDEFLSFNYIHTESENRTLYDIYLRRRRISDRKRRNNYPIRQRLPNLTETTIYDYLEQRGKNNPKCYRVPGIRLGPSNLANSSSLELSEKTRQGVPRPDRLMTLSHFAHEDRRGMFSKALVDVSNLDGFDRKYCDTIHSPEVRVCGTAVGNPSRTSGADNISSLFRLHHHKGSLEHYLERSRTAGGIPRTEEQYWKEMSSVNRDTVDMDLVTWIDKFVEQVGWKKARTMLDQEP